MRRPQAETIVLELDPDEAALVDLMCAGLSRPNLLRTALWSLADHMGYKPSLGVFDMRLWARPKRNDGQTKRSPIRKPCPRVYQHKPQPKTHPWAKANRESYELHKIKTEIE